MAGRFDLGDTITVHDHIYSETVSKLVVGVKLQIPAPGPPRLTLMFGHMPRNTQRALGRSGGGGGGGRGGGGRPRNKAGETEASRNQWQTIDVEGIVTLAADQEDDTLGVSGESTSTYVEIDMATDSSDPGSGSGTEELLRLVVLGHPIGSDPGAADSYLVIRGADGFDYKVLCVKGTSSTTRSFHV